MYGVGEVVMANKEMIVEMERDFASRFVAEQYISDGYGKHYHRNVEIYGVIKGEVTVVIAGESRTLRDGQFAVINCMEMHEYIIEKEADIFYFHIGTAYLSIFTSLYKHSLLPRWLLDAEYNKVLYEQIKNLIENKTEMTELKKYGLCNCILSDIVSYYGVMPGGYDNKTHELIEEVIQYIYVHYAEDLTLSSLAKEFYMEPKLLSKKISRFIGVDLRVFINDIRAQKALQMINDPKMRGVTKKEIASLCGIKSPRSFYRICKRNR